MIVNVASLPWLPRVGLCAQRLLQQDTVTALPNYADIAKTVPNLLRHEIDSVSVAVQGPGAAREEKAAACAQAAGRPCGRAVAGGALWAGLQAAQAGQIAKTQ